MSYELEKKQVHKLDKSSKSEQTDKLEQGSELEQSNNQTQPSKLDKPSKPKRVYQAPFLAVTKKGFKLFIIKTV